MNKIIRNTVLALAASVLTLGAVQATPVNYTFTGLTDGGSSHPGSSFNGTFSYDTADLVSGQDFVNLSSLSFTFFGDLFTLDMAVPDASGNPFAVADLDALGAVVGLDTVFSFGAGVVETTLSYGFGSPFLSYVNQDSGQQEFADLSFSPVLANTVPEPAALALGLVGLAAAGLVSQRRRS